MIFRLTCIAAGIGLLIGPIALADPATTQPSATTLPSLTPTEVFRSFLMDVQLGDAGDLGQICSAKQDDSRALLRDFEAVASAMRKLRTAATKQFGSDAAETVLPTLPSLGDLDDVTETIHGDQADVAGQTVWPMRLIRTGNHWLLDLDWLIHSDDMPANPRWFGAMAKAIGRTADDVTAGRLTTPDAAAAAMQAREQAIPDDAPTTEPATQP